MSKYFRYITDLERLKEEYKTIPNETFFDKYSLYEFLIGDPMCIVFLEEKKIEYKKRKKMED